MLSSVAAIVLTADEAWYDANPENNKLIEEIMMNLSRIGTKEQWYHWRNELFSRQTVDFHNQAAMRAWHAAIYRQHGPRVAECGLCTVTRPLFYAGRASQNLPVSNDVPCGDTDSIRGNR